MKQTVWVVLSWWGSSASQGHQLPGLFHLIALPFPSCCPRCVVEAASSSTSTVVLFLRRWPGGRAHDLGAHLIVTWPHSVAREVANGDCQAATFPAKTQEVLSPRERKEEWTLQWWRLGVLGRICHLTIVFIHLSHLLSNLLRCYLD